MRQAFGMIEVKGLATAVKVADVLVKVAAVNLIGVEPAKGAGWMTVKIIGDVGAVQAAATAAVATLTEELVAVNVIPRPAEGVVDFFITQEKPVKLTIEEPEVTENLSKAVEIIKEELPKKDKKQRKKTTKTSEGKSDE